MTTVVFIGLLVQKPLERSRSRLRQTSSRSVTNLFQSKHCCNAYKSKSVQEVLAAAFIRGREESY